MPLGIHVGVILLLLIIMLSSLSLAHGSSLESEESSCPSRGLPSPPYVYDGAFVDPSRLQWVVALSGVVGVAMAFALGANDSANSWATSVGSGAISVRSACLIGGICEWLGASLLGYGVSGTIRHGAAPPADENCWACGYCDSKMALFTVGMFSALCSAAIFLALATYTSMPVSTTHAIVGGVVGSTFAMVGGDCLVWKLDGGLGGIVASWVVSPAFAGIMGIFVYLTTEYTILRAKSPRNAALTALPVLYFISTFMIIYLILMKAKPTKGLSTLIRSIVSILVSSGAALVAQLYLVPLARQSFPSETSAQEDGFDATARALADSTWSENAAFEGSNNNNSSNNNNNNGDEMELREPGEEDRTPSFEVSAEATKVEHARRQGHRPSLTAPLAGNRDRPDGDDDDDETEDDRQLLGNAAAASSSAPVNTNETDIMGNDNYAVEREDAVSIFRHLLVFVAAVLSFAHGANDTANATAPFSAVVQAVRAGLHSERSCGDPDDPWWVLVVAGGAVCAGIISFGSRVMATVGQGLTQMDFHLAFSMNLGSATSVLLATLFGWPISSTHCQVGAVVAVGCAAMGVREVQWGMLGRIALSWILTLPFAFVLSAGLSAVLREAVRG